MPPAATQAQRTCSHHCLPLKAINRGELTTAANLYYNLNTLPMSESPQAPQPSRSPSLTLPRQYSERYDAKESCDMLDRTSSYSHVVPLQDKKIFGFEIFIDNAILKQFGDSEAWFQKLMSENQVESIRFNRDLCIPDLDGTNIQVYSTYMEHKYQCCKNILENVSAVFKRKNSSEPFYIIIFVPEGMVSLLIGTRGHQINRIMKESHTVIVINQPINKMTYRTAKITGKAADIARACRIIYEILQEKSVIAYSIEKQPSQMDYTKAKLKARFILPSQLTHYVEKKKKHYIKSAEDSLKCYCKFQDASSYRHLRKDEVICCLSGRLEDVQSLAAFVLNLCQELVSQDPKNLDYTLKILIPSNYVTKLIGQKGYMIKDIIEKSGGASIKISSDKHIDRDNKECMISIAGTIENKIDGACYILEQIECFKNGGPILQSGKLINENIAEQFKNSIPCQEFEKENTSQQLCAETNSSRMDSNYLHGLFPSREDNEKSEEEGLIEEPNSENTPKLEVGKKSVERGKKKKRHSSSRSSSNGASNRSRRRERSRKKRKNSRRSRSSSAEYRFDREYLRMKIVVPKKLADDHRQLKYISQKCRSEITVREGGEPSQQATLLLEGKLKDNQKSLQYIQKRLARLHREAATSSQGK